MIWAINKKLAELVNAHVHRTGPLANHFQLNRVTEISRDTKYGTDSCLFEIIQIVHSGLGALSTGNITVANLTVQPVNSFFSSWKKFLYRNIYL